MGSELIGLKFFMSDVLPFLCSKIITAFCHAFGTWQSWRHLLKSRVRRLTMASLPSCRTPPVMLSLPGPRYGPVSFSKPQLLQAGWQVVHHPLVVYVVAEAQLCLFVAFYTCTAPGRTQYSMLLSGPCCESECHLLPWWIWAVFCLCTACILHASGSCFSSWLQGLVSHWKPGCHPSFPARWPCRFECIQGCLEWYHLSSSLFSSPLAFCPGW